MEVDSSGIQIIGKRKYTVNLTPSELFQKLEQYLCQPEEEGGPATREWIPLPGGTAGHREFQLNLFPKFLLMRRPSIDIEKPFTSPKDIRKLEREFYGSFFKKSREVLKNLSHDVPFHLEVLIAEADELRSVCETICRPVLHEKIRKGLVSMKDVPEDRRRDSYNRSLGFLDKVFVGELRAKRTTDVSPGGPRIDRSIRGGTAAARIYISSTYSDLKNYREAVYQTLRQMRHDVIAMEDYVATDQRPVNKCLGDVAACSIYVGIFAWRYGHIPVQDGPEKRSITELEYGKAGEVGIPRLIFLLDDEAPWPPNLMDAHTGEAEQGKRIMMLRNRLKKEQTVSFFRTTDDLARKVSIAVAQQVGDRPEQPDEKRKFLFNLATQMSDIQLALRDPDDHAVNPFLQQLLYDLGATARILSELGLSPIARELGIVNELKDLSSKLESMESYEFNLGRESWDGFISIGEQCLAIANRLYSQGAKRYTETEKSLSDFRKLCRRNIEILKNEWEKSETYLARGQIDSLKERFRVLGYDFHRLGSIPEADRYNIGLQLRELGKKLRTLSSMKYFIIGVGIDPVERMRPEMHQVLNTANEILEAIP